MTELLRELEAVVGLLNAVDGKEGLVLEKMQMLSSTGLFIRTHHAEIAEALKDARRWRHFRRELALGKPDVFAAMNDAIPDDATDTPAVIEPFIDSGIDAAIDAHNSAREVGE